MIRWVFAATAIMVAHASSPLGDAAQADERPALERLAMLRNGDGGTGGQIDPNRERHAQARSCKAVSSCEEAVRLWCGGYRRADGDNDGIPCENVCSSLSEVEAIKAEIGC